MRRSSEENDSGRSPDENVGVAGRHQGDGKSRKKEGRYALETF